jgi:hypothetical protein
MSREQRGRLGRNDPCHCGSGEKYKRCHWESDQNRPREIATYIGHPDEKFDSVRFRDGKVEAIHLYSGEWVKPTTFTNITYPRASGKHKVLASIPDYGPVQLARKFLEYTAIYMVDTNTDIIDDTRVSIGCIVECRAYLTDPERVTVEPNPNYAIIPCKNGKKGFEERRTWLKLVEMVQASPRYRDELHFAIVTDHDFRNHARYKSGELPFYGNKVLPPNFDLLFMTTDTLAPDRMNQILIRQGIRGFEVVHAGEPS